MDGECGVYWGFWDVGLDGKCWCDWGLSMLRATDIIYNLVKLGIRYEY